MASKGFHQEINILAVDDQPANLLAIEAVLGAAYNVVRANSGPEAIALVQSLRDIDVILMDVQMPGMDGFETATRIKELPSARDIPIVFITAIFKEDRFVRRGYQVGGIDYFYKPFDPEILKLKVGVYAKLKQRSDGLRERERQVRISEGLLATGRKLSSILETLPLGVIIADLEGRICQINDAVSRVLKAEALAEADLYGDILRWWNNGGTILRDWQGPLARALKGSSQSHHELIAIHCLDGSEKTIMCSASSLRRHDGQTVGAVLVLQDLSEPAIIEKDLERRIAQLVALGVELDHSATATLH